MILNKCCLSLCLTYYRREWNTLGPPDNKLSLFSPTRLCRWSLLSHASMHCGISAMSLPHVSVMWHLNSKQYHCQLFLNLKKNTHTHTNHTTYISNTKIYYLKHQNILFETHYQTHFSLYEYYKYVCRHQNFMMNSQPSDCSW